MRTIKSKQAARELRRVADAMYAGILKELPVALLAAEADFKQRVFLRGLTTDGKSIGKYSTKPFYADITKLREEYGSQLPLAKLKPRGKPRFGRKKGFTTRRYRGERIDLVSEYFEGGYKAFREKLGRDGSRVNFKLSGALERSIQTGVSQNVGVIGFTNSRRADIAEDLEDRFSVVVFKLSDKEVEKVYKRLQAAAIRSIP